MSRCNVRSSLMSRPLCLARSSRDLLGRGRQRGRGSSGSRQKVGGSRGHIRCIFLTEPTDAAQACSALFESVKAAIVSCIAHIEHCAPRIILGLRGAANPGRNDKNSQDEQQASHSRLPALQWLSVNNTAPCFLSATDPYADPTKTTAKTTTTTTANSNAEGYRRR